MRGWHTPAQPWVENRATINGQDTRVTASEAALSMSGAPQTL
jgi:hypothetical protein